MFLLGGLKRLRVRVAVAVEFINRDAKDYWKNAFSRRSLLGHFVANDVMNDFLPCPSRKYPMEVELRRFYEHQVDQCRPFIGAYSANIRTGKGRGTSRKCWDSDEG